MYKCNDPKATDINAGKCLQNVKSMPLISI